MFENCLITTNDILLSVENLRENNENSVKNN